MPRSSFLLCALLGLLGAAAVPGAASATDFCVAAPPGCTGTAVARDGLATALAAAASNGTADRFVLASGVFSAASFASSSAEPVQITGAGQGQTILRATTGPAAVTLGGAATLSDLTVEGAGAGATIGLDVTGATVRRVTVDDPAGVLENGALLRSGAVLDRSVVRVAKAGAGGVGTLAGQVTVSDTTIRAPFIGLGAAASRTTVRGTTIHAGLGVAAAGGRLDLADSLVDVRGTTGTEIGLLATTESGGDPVLDAQRVTVAGDGGPADAPTVGVGVAGVQAGHTASLTLRDGIVTGFDVPLGRQGVQGPANLSTRHSAYGPTTNPIADTGPGVLDEVDRLGADPLFADAAHGDFHLREGSPLVDAAQAAVPDGTTDADGRPRPSDGDGDCVHRADVGAFELQGTRPRAVAAAAAPSAAVGAPVAFSADGSCAPLPGPAPAAWSFDDGASASGTSVSHAFATPGRHTATLTVDDGAGHRATAEVAVDVVADAGAGAGGTGSGGAAGLPAPVLSRLALTPSRVVLGRALPRLLTPGGALRRGASAIRVTLSAPATLQLRVARVRGGGRRAVAVGGTLRIRAAAGTQRIRFAGRLTRRTRLAPGRYVLTAVAVDAAGRRSAPRTARFSVVRAPARRRAR